MSMGKSPYKRKTNSPKMGWSDERRAKFSAQCREAHANNTWFKKSKKVGGRNISNGLKNAAKFRNRSEAMKKSWERRRAAKSIMNHAPTTLSENLLDSAPLPLKEVQEFIPEKIESKPEVSDTEILPILMLKRIENLFDMIEKNFGIQPDLNAFIINAVDDKMSEIEESLNSYVY